MSSNLHFVDRLQMSRMSSTFGKLSKTSKSFGGLLTVINKCFDGSSIDSRVKNDRKKAGWHVVDGRCWVGLDGWIGFVMDR